MMSASFVSAKASSERNITCSSKFSVQKCALFSGSLTAKLKCQTAASCTFKSVAPPSESRRARARRRSDRNACPQAWEDCKRNAFRFGRRVYAGLMTHDIRELSLLKVDKQSIH